ncbi:MAG TPA: VanW family protein [Desulfitobacteriaceae bacterium]|nr:VanW family protein [Desulfitobacteriaceae bacterium]
MADKHQKRILTVLGISLIVILIFSISLNFYSKDQGVIITGIKAFNIDISNLTKKEAIAKILPETTALLKQPITLQIENKIVLLPLDQTGLTFAVEKTIDQAYQLGRNGNIFQKAITKAKAKFFGINLPLIPNWDDAKLKDNLKKNLTPYEQAAIDAAYLISEDNQITIQAGKNGRAIDLDRIISQIKALDILKPEPIIISCKEVSPVNSTVELEKYKITGLLVNYSTIFDPYEVNRTENIRLAVQKLNGKLVKPGETFSFNDTVGPRSPADGYKIAPIFVKGQIVNDFGGGICQVSSTLYNALLLADLPIIERNNHDLAVKYVPRGLDATVCYGILDLKFKNDTDGYILIKCKIEQNSLIFNLYGQVKANREVIISTSSDYSQVIVTWRTVKFDGNISKKEKISSSHYLN